MPKAREHTYRTRVVWTGDLGTGTSGYRDYDRGHEVSSEGPPPLLGTADPAFLGSAEAWNPEQLLLASLAQCHMLTYLALCSLNGVAVTGYEDLSGATMTEDGAGGGAFTEAVLRPRVRVASAAVRERALALHEEAHRKCFIANSVTFPVRCEPTVEV
ncbi:OsmC family protein [Streptomyces catenulae]|uniref:OsmC family protein n=1 Tax=Streptomyces catenulae TaxID=66875 RepID=A0ABV2YTY5_9ACTN|nr:OsmC family protein [Streptomyces catenulae]